MDLLLGLCTLFQLFLSSSSICGFRQQRPNLDSLPEQSEEPEAPWIVNIFGNGKSCQGVVLSSWWVLTAANCFLTMLPSHVELTGASGRTYTETVSQFVPHKGFSPWDETPNNDLGLVMLGQPLDLAREDMWPACTPSDDTAFNSQEGCKIFERSVQGSIQEITLNDLETSVCAVEWPDTKKELNLCVTRNTSEDTSCTVPVGSPVICHNPRNGQWEAMGIVTQSLENCTAPILASQLLSHLKWLKKEGAIEDTDTEAPSPVPEQVSYLTSAPTLKAYVVKHVSLKPSTPPAKPSSTANNVILIAPSTAQKLSHETPKVMHYVLQTTNPLTATTQSSTTVKETPEVPPTTILQTSTAAQQLFVTSTTAQQLFVTSTTAQQLFVTSTTAQQPSTTQTSVSIASSTPKQATVKTPTFKPPHVIIIPATTPRTTSPMPTTDVNRGAPVSFVVAASRFTRVKREESRSTDPTPALRVPPVIPHLGLPVQVKSKQCEIGLAWNSDSHTYQLSKMAILIDRKVGCGLRPGFVPKCPSCSEAEMGEFPWIVSLSLSIQHFCAGSILNRWWILTTANCANLIKNSEALALVQVGLIDVSKPTRSVQIRQALTHPKSLEQGDLHNLGLLELEKPLDFGPLVSPICISGKADMMGDFRDCWLPGWTVLEGGPTVLLRYHIDILNISSCNQLEDTLSGAIFCVKAQMGKEGVCKGDVGSPLICPDPKGGAWLQLGVLSSFDEACSRPYVFSSLPHYLPWLEKITKAEGHRYNLSVPWERLGPARNLRLLREPETLVGWISAQSSLPWQALVATCANVSCGGSILSHYWVLTTAQCVREADPEGTAVFVGLMHPKGHVKGVRVAGIYLSPNSSVALLLLQKPIAFNKYITRMASSATASWDSCKVMGLQILQSGEIQVNPSAYQVKVLLPSDCAKEYPGVKPAMYCIVRDNSSYLPAEAVGEGAALLCSLESKSTSWRQVGFVSAPLPGSQAVILSSCISSYADWIEETSERAKHLVHLSHGSAPLRPNIWLLLLILSLFGATELG
nr:uncharacterized protein LOC132766536 [Anolis sagrei ordinatus]